MVFTVDLFFQHRFKLYSYTLIFCLFNSLLGINVAKADHFEYELNAISENKIKIGRSQKDNAVIAINTSPLKDEVQGNIPARIVADNEHITFENDVNYFLWHGNKSVTDKINNHQVSHSPYVYLTLDIDDDLKGKDISIIIRKEENQSRLATVAAFFPQLIPVFIANDVTWGPAPTLFYETLMRWNYKVIGSDVSSLVRNIAATKAFDDKTELLSKCTADFVEGFVLFEMANYGDSTGEQRGKINTFRHYMATAPMKKVMDCMSRVVSDVAIDLAENPESDSFKFLSKLNNKSIEGISQIVVGYGFNTIAFQAGDLFGNLKRNIGLTDAGSSATFQDDIDRSLAKAIQYTLQAGYEDLFQGISEDYGLDGRIGYAMAGGVGLIEMFTRLYIYQGVSDSVRDKRHQFHSFAKRAEAMGVSFNRWIAIPEFNDFQLLTLGVALPVVSYAAVSLLNGHVSSGLFHLLNNAYEGITLGALTFLISPVLQKHGSQTIRYIQKPVLDYVGADNGSWSEYILAEDIHYRVDLVVEDE